MDTKLKLPINDAKALKGVKRLGIIGGSFNPAHDGHVHIAKWAKKILNLDSVWFMVAKQNPWKNKESMAPMEKRKESIEKKMQEMGNPAHMHVSMAENTWNVQYTSDMIALLKSNIPKDIQVFFIMGDDVWRSWHKFNRVGDIMHQVPMVVMARKYWNIWLSRSTWRYMLAYKNARKMQAQKVRCPAWTFINQPINESTSTDARVKQQKKWWLP